MRHPANYSSLSFWTSAAGRLFRRRWFSPAIAVAIVLAIAAAASACPSCKAALGDSSEGQRLVRGYFLSICFMVAMPFTVFGGLSAYLYWLVRSARRQGPPANDAPASHDEPIRT